jgi:hypothetical protein
MKYNKLLILVMLFTIVSGCSLFEEESTSIHLSSDGKMIYSPVENNQSEDPEEVEEPPEIEISNPMKVREMSAPEMQLPELSPPEMQLREMRLRDD